jgi:TorA maturation chaperone TorD
MSASKRPALDATAKGALSALLARLFAGEPDLALYRQLRAVEHPALTWVEPALLALPEARAVEALAVEYCRLFIGPQPACPPYASAQGGEVLLGGRPRTRLDAFLVRHGVPAPDPGWRIASPDHIAVELAVLARLYAGDAPAAVVQELLTQHLWPWAPAWLAHVASASRYQLYRTAAQLGVALLDDEHAVPRPRGTARDD